MHSEMRNAGAINDERYVGSDVISQNRQTFASCAIEINSFGTCCPGLVFLRAIDIVSFRIDHAISVIIQDQSNLNVD